MPTEAEIVMGYAGKSFRLGGMEFHLRALTMEEDAAWRRKIAAMLGSMTVGEFQASPVAALLVSGHDAVIELLLARVPELTLDDVWATAVGREERWGAMRLAVEDCLPFVRTMAEMMTNFARDGFGQNGSQPGNP